MPTPQILVVEDEENIAFVVVAALRLAGFDVVEARSGREGLRMTAERGPPTSSCSTSCCRTWTVSKSVADCGLRGLTLQWCF